jgi:DNA-binding NtrC family response regulator
VLPKKDKILVIEDEVLVAETLCQTLKKFGYARVEWADSIEKARQLLEKRSYAMVLLDINMGEATDGITMISEQKKKKDIPLIYITGKSDGVTLKRAKATTPLAFITKPISETNLRIQLELFRDRV